MTWVVEPRNPDMMDSDRQLWWAWSVKLKQFGIAGWLAEFLEAAGPLNILGAQLLYIGQPLLSQFWSWNSLEKAAHLLENPVERLVFTRFLREDKFV